MPNQKQININLPNNNIINCFGIQPILVESEMPDRISLFSINRYKKWKDDATTNNVYYMPVLYKGWDAKRIYDKAIRNEIAELYGLNLLLRKSLHIKINKSLSALRENKEELRKLLLYYSELLKYRNRLNAGNFFITSDKLIHNNIKFSAKQLRKFDKYLINPLYLEENIIIVGAKGTMNFDNQIMAVPFIDNYDYNRFLLNKGIVPSKEIKLEIPGKAYPIVDYYRKKYDNYELYLNEKVPLKWHFETFKHTNKFYISLHLNP